MQEAGKINLWEASDLDFEAEPTTKCRLQAKSLAQFQNSTIKAQPHANEKDMFCLPSLWPWDSQTDELRRLSGSVPADVAGPLKSLSEWVLRDLSATVQVGHVDPSNSKYWAKVVEGAVNNCSHSAQFTAEFTGNRLLDMPSGDHVVLSAFHDIGIPEQCTDILHLLLDELLHPFRKKIDRYYRVWSRSGAAMLVSSTTVRSFNAAGYLVKVRPRVFIEKTQPEACHRIRVTT